MSARVGNGSWEFFVRETLTRLSTDLRSGLITVRVDNGGQRYVVDAPGNTGRNIIVPCNKDALMVPPHLPPRDPRGLLSPFTIGTVSTATRVNVPWSAIRRDYSINIEVVYGAELPCLGCAIDNCMHGWTTPPPEAIVVLRLRGQDGDDVFGWYVRFATATRNLVRVPVPVVRRLMRYMRDDLDLRESSLVNRYTDVGVHHRPSGVAFNAAAFDRFSKFRIRMTKAASKACHKRKRTASDGPSSTFTTSEFITSESTESTESNTCVICLEEDPSAVKRCRHSSCGAHTCASCHSHTRGLCPLCDRSAINADYPCSRCNSLFRLRKYGYPCIECSANCLCEGCYKEFGECGACETDPVAELS